MRFRKSLLKYLSPLSLTGTSLYVIRAFDFRLSRKLGRRSVNFNLFADAEGK